MKSIYKAICVTWLGFWAVIATLILGTLVMVAGLLSRTGNLAFSISKLWAHTMLDVSFVRTEIKKRIRFHRGHHISLFSTTNRIMTS